MDLNYKHSLSWLCEQHSLDKIKTWVNSLSSFYFFRAFGGHANDPDSFETEIIYEDAWDLNNIFSVLHVTGLSEENPFGNFYIDHNRWLLSVDYRSQRLTFSRSTNYNVTDEDFEATLKLDKTFKALGLDKKVDRQIIQDPCCVSAERYNTLFH